MKHSPCSSGLDAPIVAAAHGTVAGGGLRYVYAGDIVIAARAPVSSRHSPGLGVAGIVAGPRVSPA